MSGTYITYPPLSSGGGSTGSGSGVNTVGAVNGQSPAPNGATIVGTSLFLQTAQAGDPGLIVGSGSQSLAGVYTFTNSPLISGLANNAQVSTNGSGQLVSSSVSLTTQVTGILPAANTQPLSSLTGSVSLTTQVSGVLPNANMSPVALSNTAQVTGSASLTNQVVGVLPLANLPNIPFTQTIGSLTTSQISAAALSPNAQVSTNAAGQLAVASVSLTTQVTGVLPNANMSQVTLSNAAQVGGILPQANLTLAPTFTQATTGSVTQTSSAGGAAYTVRWPGTQGGANQVPTNDGAGNISWRTPSAGAATTGSVSITSSAGGSAYTTILPGTQIVGSLSVLAGNALGQMVWWSTGATKQLFTTVGSFTYTTPFGCTLIKVTAIGGGGGGGGVATGAAAGAAGAGGGGGSTAIKWLSGANLPSSFALSIPAGGPGGVAGNNIGSNGGNAWFSLVTGSVSAGGGSGGNGSAALSGTGFVSGGGAGGTSTGGDINASGGSGVCGVIFTAAGNIPGNGGASSLAGAVLTNSGSFNTNSAGANGNFPGGAGSGAGQVTAGGNFAGGNGAQGMILVEEFYV